MAKIDEVRARLLNVLAQKYGVEKQLEELNRQADGLFNQLAVLEELERAEAPPDSG